MAGIRHIVTFTRRQRGVLLLALMLSLVLPVLLGGAPVFGALRGLSLQHLAALVLLMVLVWHLNIARLLLLLGSRPPGLNYWRIIRIYLAIECFSKATPAGAGGAVAAAYYLRRLGVSLHRAFALFAASALMDLVALSLCLVAILSLAEGGGVSFRWLLTIMLPALSVLLLGIWLADRFNRHLLRLSGVVLAHLGVPWRWRRRSARALLKLHAAVRSMLSLPVPRLLLALLLCLLMWGLYLSVLFLVVRALGGDLGWPQGAMTQALAMGLGHVFMLPGAAGSAEAVGAMLLTPPLGAVLAGATILCWRFLTLYLHLLLGALAVFSLGRDALMTPALDRD